MQEKNKKITDNKYNQVDIRVIICGGDGTIIWGIQQCLNSGLDISQIIFCTLPIGTGNDFSRTVGWGVHPLRFYDNDILPLKRRVIEWLHSSVIKYDVWEVQITTYQDTGLIQVVKNKQDFTLQNNKCFKKGFVNYVGFGIDARVSYNFEKNRKSSKCMNLAVYGCFGLYFLFKESPQLSRSLQYFEYQYEDLNNQQSNAQEQSPNYILKQGGLNQSDKSMFEQFTKNSSQNPYGQSRISSTVNLKQGYHSLLCLNSISYMAGSMNLWDSNKLGIKQKQQHFKKQQINDGKIQFLGFKNELRLGLQRVFHNAGKIAQGQGPFHIKFKDQQKQQINYIQIDGQGMKFRGIKEIIVRKYNRIIDGKINVMVKNTDIYK